MIRIRPLFLLALVLAGLLAPLAACGRRGPLEPPQGQQPTYPRTYPHEES